MNFSLLDLVDSWLLSLKGQGRPATTIRSYKSAVLGYLRDHPELTKAEVTAWLAEQAESSEPASTRMRLAAIKQFAKWLAEEEGFDADPILVLKAPKLNQKPVPALSDNEIKAMIGACAGPGFRNVRDRAILMLMAETGVRAQELLGMRAEDVTPLDCVGVVNRGKGGDGRRVQFSAATATELDRYMRLRARAGWRPSDPLWIGKSRPLDYKGLARTLKKRAEKAGVSGFHLHRLRHTAAVRWLRAGGSESGLMAQAGWKSREMIDRYVKTAAEELAAEEFRRLNIGLSF